MICLHHQLSVTPLEAQGAVAYAQVDHCGAGLNQHHSLVHLKQLSEIFHTLALCAHVGHVSHSDGQAFRGI